MSGGDPPSPGDRETRTWSGAGRRPEVGDRIADRYRIEEVLGFGAMGAVYAARDESLHVDVALKVLRPELGGDFEARERFRREIVLSRQVSHPNVVRIHDLGQDGDFVFLSMDLVRGRSLRDRLESEGALPPDEARELIRRLAEGLAAAHGQGIIHRDLKPENILLSEDGTPRIADFGVAYAAGQARLTETGMLVGTLSYLSPEQAAGESVDARSDLYALGLIAVEALTGELPFRRSSQQEMLAQRMVSSPRLESLEGVVDVRWRSALAGLLARDREDRLPSAEAFLAALEGEPTAKAPVWSARRPLFARRGLVAVVAITVAAGLGLAWWLLRGRAAETPAPEAGTGGTASLEHSLAVLPFLDETGDPSLAWMSRGTAEMLAGELAASPELQVVDSLRVFRSLGDLGLTPPWDPGGLRTLSDLLGVDRAITGRVRSLGDGLAVEAWSVRPGESVASGETAQVEIENPRELPLAVGKLAGELAADLAVPIRATAAAAALSPAARQAYDEGLQLWVRGDALGAVPRLEKATAEEPAFTTAWIHLADAYAAQGRQEDTEHALDQATAAGPAESSRAAFEIRVRRARLHGDVDEAKTLSRELVERFPGDVEARVTLARVLGEAGDLAGAREALEQVVAQDPKHPQAWYLLAKYSIQAGEAEVAVDDYLVRALVLQNRLENEQGRADVLNAMGVAYDHLGRFDEALEHYGEAAEIRERIGDRRGLATSLRNLSAIHAIRGDAEEAEAELARAETILQELGDRSGLADLANDQGLLAEEQGGYREALDAYRKGLGLRRDLGDRRGVAESAYNVSFVYYLLGELDNAQAFARQAADLFEEGGVREGLVFARQMLATLGVARGDWGEATRLFGETLETSRELGMQDTTAVALGGLGDLARLQGEPGRAARLYAQAREAVTTIGDQRGEVEFALDEASLRIGIGQNAAAADLLHDVGEQLGEGGNREQRSHWLTLRAALARLEGDPAAAKTLAVEARDLAAEAGAELARLDAEAERGEAEAERRPQAALVSLGEALAAARGIGHRPLELALAEALARAELAAGRDADAVPRLRAALRGLGDDPYEGRYRLQALLARGLEAAGDADGAAEARAAARAEVERLRRALPEGAEADFLALPEVHALLEAERAA